MSFDGHAEPGAKFNAASSAEGWPGLCDHTLAFRRPELAAMNALWHQLAGDASIPKRTDMTPRLLKDHLPHIAIYERVTAGEEHRYRARLMGTQFAQVMGDLTGKFIDSVIPPQFLPRWTAALDAVLDGGVPLRFVSRSDTANKSFLVGEFFEAPLLTDDGSMSLVIADAIFTRAENWQSLMNGVVSKFEIGPVAV